ncbi:hypothetical protein POJ06DRAFT_244353 [Lipomyces tetrasporus]|uniref:Uncharacterized protein n=1 Tax=Lipomyces tetrasporus TaxID=54092 RepID=A0AAD7R0I2_9ASCO|nr:uncharacterized protein POJ06DRAFT_244353 [Lipomyces tetrasporus]KAJ8104376.1 hypothetical protein POJ06DRAFT_244353 [Lipomyces tetrasporus]
MVRLSAFLLAVVAICAVATADVPLLCILQGNFNEGAPYNQPGSYWLFISDSIDNHYSNAYYIDSEIARGKAASTNGLVTMLLKSYITAESNKVYAYFYSNDGSPGENVAFATYAGYAFHFTARNDFVGRSYMTAGDVVMYITAGSCVTGEYEWPYTKKGARLTPQGWLAQT